MTNLQNARLIIEDLKIKDRDRIIELMWCPLQLIYVELAKSGDIKRLTDLDPERKENYWKEVCLKNPEAMKHKKIWICQALYVFDEVTKNNL